MAALRKRYAKASKKERDQILDDYVHTTGYHQKWAIAVLSRKPTRRASPLRRPRPAVYTAEDAQALEKLSRLFDGINAKLLRATSDHVGLYAPAGRSNHHGTLSDSTIRDISSSVTGREAMTVEQVITFRLEQP